MKCASLHASEQYMRAMTVFITYCPLRTPLLVDWRWRLLRRIIGIPYTCSVINISIITLSVLGRLRNNDVNAELRCRRGRPLISGRLRCWRLAWRMLTSVAGRHK